MISRNFQSVLLSAIAISVKQIYIKRKKYLRNNRYVLGDYYNNIFAYTNIRFVNLSVQFRKVFTFVNYFRDSTSIIV